jgi:hypothetical protein
MTVDFKPKKNNMKKLLPFLSLALIAAACNQGQKAGLDTATAAAAVQQTTPAIDTTGIAAYQAWKAQHELVDVQPYVQTVSSAPVERKSPAKKITHTPARKAPVTSTEAPATTPQKPSSNDGAVANTGTGGTGTSESTGEAKATEKKGMSKAVKGAIIGGAGGAVAGAVLNKKNRVAGAVIGGVIGAGGGYVIGRQMDKNDNVLIMQ